MVAERGWQCWQSVIRIVKISGNKSIPAKHFEIKKNYQRTPERAIGKIFSGPTQKKTELAHICLIKRNTLLVRTPRRRSLA